MDGMGTDLVTSNCLSFHKRSDVVNIHVLKKSQVMKEPGLCSMCWLRRIGSSMFLFNKIAVMAEMSSEVRR